MNFNTSKIFDYTIKKIQRGYPLNQIVYQKFDDELIVEWNHGKLHIERQDNGKFIVEYFHELYPKYDMEFYEVNPYHLIRAIDYIYARIDFDLNKTPPSKLY